MNVRLVALVYYIPVGGCVGGDVIVFFEVGCICSGDGIVVVV